MAKLQMDVFVNLHDNITNKLKGVEKQVSKFGQMSQKLQGVLGNLSRTFSMWALSIMFAGMQIQRVFQRIITSSVDAFNKIIESSGFAGTALNQLSAYWTYLRFEIGRVINTALAPLMPYIISIINLISAWIQKHPKLIAALLALGVAIGFVAFWAGSFILAAQGLISMFAAVAKAILWLITNFWTLIEIGSMVFGAIAPYILPIIGALVGIGLIIAGLILSVMNWGKEWDKVLYGIGLVLLGIAIIAALVFGAWIPALVLAVIALFAFLAGYILSKWQELNMALTLLWQAWVGLIQSIVDFIVAIFDLGIALIQLGWAYLTEWLQAILTDFLVWVQETFGVNLELIWQNIIDFIKGLWDGLKQYIVDIITWITEQINKITEKIQAVTSKVQSVTSSVQAKTSSVKGKQFGGDIPETGMYLMHRGEKVQTPYQGGNSSNGGINITINGSVDETVYRKLLHEIKRYTSHANLGR